MVAGPVPGRSGVCGVVPVRHAPEDPGLLKLAAEKRRRIEQGVICPKCHRRRVRAWRHVGAPSAVTWRICPAAGNAEADEPSRGRVVRPMPETGPGTGQADVPEMRQVPVPRGRGHVRRCRRTVCCHPVLVAARRGEGSPDGLCGRCRRSFRGGEDMICGTWPWRPCTCWVY